MRIFLPNFTCWIFISLFISTAVLGQPVSEASTDQNILKVAIHPQAPYIIEGENQKWDGISIQLWREVAERLQLKYQLISIPADAQEAALHAGDIDIALLSSVLPDKDTVLNYSHFYHTAYLGIAMQQSNDLQAIASAFFSTRFWQIVLMISVLLLIVGTVIYFIERTSNDDNFGGERSIIKGIGAGFWWAGVTMTTIGYGDKAPVTFFGRAVALFWMLIAMGVTSVLTAGLVSAMGGTYSKKINIPENLHDMQVAAVENTPAATYLNKEGVNFQSYASLTKAIKAVENNESEIVINNVPALKYTLNNSNNLALEIQPKKLHPQIYAMVFREGSVLRESINQALLQIIKSDQWQQQLQRFIPETSKN